MLYYCYICLLFFNLICECKWEFLKKIFLFRLIYPVIFCGIDECKSRNETKINIWFFSKIFIGLGGTGRNWPELANCVPEPLPELPIWDVIICCTDRTHRDTDVIFVALKVSGSTSSNSTGGGFTECNPRPDWTNREDTSKPHTMPLVWRLLSLSLSLYLFHF